MMLASVAMSYGREVSPSVPTSSGMIGLGSFLPGAGSFQKLREIMRNQNDRNDFIQNALQPNVKQAATTGLLLYGAARMLGNEPTGGACLLGAFGLGLWTVDASLKAYGDRRVSRQLEGVQQAQGVHGEQLKAIRSNLQTIDDNMFAVKADVKTRFDNVDNKLDAMKKENDAYFSGINIGLHGLNQRQQKAHSLSQRLFGSFTSFRQQYNRDTQEHTAGIEGVATTLSNFKAEQREFNSQQRATNDRLEKSVTEVQSEVGLVKADTAAILAILTKQK